MQNWCVKVNLISWGFFLSPPSYIPSITAISVISNSSLELSLTGTPITGIISVK